MGIRIEALLNHSVFIPPLTLHGGASPRNKVWQASETRWGKPQRQDGASPRDMAGQAPEVWLLTHFLHGQLVHKGNP